MRNVLADKTAELGLLRRIEADHFTSICIYFVYCVSFKLQMWLDSSYFLQLNNDAQMNYKAKLTSSDKPHYLTPTCCKLYCVPLCSILQCYFGRINLLLFEKQSKCAFSVYELICNVNCVYHCKLRTCMCFSHLGTTKSTSRTENSAV